MQIWCQAICSNSTSRSPSSPIYKDRLSWLTHFRMRTIQVRATLIISYSSSEVISLQSTKKEIWNWKINEVTAFCSFESTLFQNYISPLPSVLSEHFNLKNERLIRTSKQFDKNNFNFRVVIWMDNISFAHEKATSRHSVRGYNTQ